MSKITESTMELIIPIFKYFFSVIFNTSLSKKFAQEGATKGQDSILLEMVVQAFCHEGHAGE